MDEDTRFWAKVDMRGETECWPWLASLDRHGYGEFGTGNKVAGTRRTQRAHRLAYEKLRGPIEAGLHLDHLCRNRACVNPGHLEPVTQQENIRRGENGRQWAAKTQCPAGHPYEGRNVLLSTNERGGLVRRCRACAYARTEACRKARRLRQRASTPP